ncbi:MAG: GIY-YIG nuclease family protein [Bacteroidales bacterium]
MTIIKAIKFLKQNEIDFLKTVSFSQSPGIYAFFYIGNDFPFLEDIVQQHQIIYIGKTESSQENRDAKTHFATGKTGSSTVRKSIGSILYSSRNLKPIPRNDTDYQKRKFSHFKFDDPSEEILTTWMKENLALSFFEYPRSKKEIEDLETRIIDKLVPVLNISKNPKNPFRAKLLQLRKTCALIAREKSTKFASIPQNEVSEVRKTVKKKDNMNTNCIIINNISASDIKSKQIRITVENKYLFPDEIIGNRLTHNLFFAFNNQSFSSKYTIGSIDGKSRSGILKLDKELYLEKLKIQERTILKIYKIGNDDYKIEKN